MDQQNIVIAPEPTKLNILMPADMGKTTQGTRSSMDYGSEVTITTEEGGIPLVRTPKSFYTKSKKRPFKGTNRAKRLTARGGNFARG